MTKGYVLLSGLGVPNKYGFPHFCFLMSHLCNANDITLLLIERLQASLEYNPMSENAILAKASEHSSHRNKCDMQGESLTPLCH